MAWDNDRPYAPFRLSDGSMLEWHSDTPEAKDIDRMYGDGGVVVGVPRNWVSQHGKPYAEFRPFREMKLKLTYQSFKRGRSAVTFFWMDEEGHEYPMFASELDRLLSSGVLRNVMDGKWSAQKRGANYGITFVVEANDD